MLLRHCRLAAGLSQAALAERAQVSAKGIGALERGERRTPQRETLALLAGALALDDEQRREFETAAMRTGLPRRGASVSVGPWPDNRVAYLPLAPASFVGRETDIKEIAGLVREHRMVTLTGAGGVGKTQTALRVATSLNATGGAVCFIALAPINDPSLVAATIASTLGVGVPNRPLLETLMAYLKNKPLLLILDNCEHVIAEAAIVADALLASCPGVRILATSRESLRAVGEYSYRLPSLSLPLATELFIDRARAADHRFALTEEDAPAVAEICRRLDGIPLAIELAAPRTNLLSVKALAEKLDDRFRLLAGGARTALPRQQTMRAVIDWSYNLLSAREQKLFERLSVFAGGCTLATATAVCGDEERGDDGVFGLLSSLVDKSLVVADLAGREPRCRLLESFREYAREKLAESDEGDIVAHRHARAYLELAQRLDRAYYCEQETWQTLVHDELDNWRAALQWALPDRGDVLLGQQLTGELTTLWLYVAPAEGRRWLASAQELSDDRTPTSVLARLSYTEATIAHCFAQNDVLLASSRVAAARFRAIGDSFGTVLAQTGEVQALCESGRFVEARSVLEEALPLARSLGNRWLVAWVLRLFGGVSTEDSDFLAARYYLDEALQSFEAVGAGIDVAWTMNDLSWMEFRANNIELALEPITGALATFRAFKHARGVSSTLNTKAMLFVSLARYAEAERSGREALGVAREHRLDLLAAIALQNLAAIAALRLQDGAEYGPSACERAARVLGFVNARFVAAGSLRVKGLQQEYDRVLAVLRATLGADSVAELMAAGAAMTEERAAEEAYSAS